jgi:hypothetical protein
MKRLLLSTTLAAAILTPSLADEIKVPLFNGTDFTGWKIVSDPKKQPSPQPLFTLSDGAIHTYAKAKTGTDQPFGGLITQKSSIDMKQWDAATTSWKPLTEGRILLQAEGAEVSYRNIPLTALPENEKDLRPTDK